MCLNYAVVGTMHNVVRRRVFANAQRHRFAHYQQKRCWFCVGWSNWYEMRAFAWGLGVHGFLIFILARKSRSAAHKQPEKLQPDSHWHSPISDYTLTHLPDNPLSMARQWNLSYDLITKVTILIEISNNKPTMKPKDPPVMISLYLPNIHTPMVSENSHYVLSSSSSEGNSPHIAAMGIPSPRYAWVPFLPLRKELVAGSGMALLPSLSITWSGGWCHQRPWRTPNC